MRFLAENLDESGDAIIATPNIYSLACRIGFLFKGRLPGFDDKAEPTYIYPVFFDAFEKVLHVHGLRIVDSWGYPERGSQRYRRATMVLSTLLSLICAEDRRGDVLCLRIAHSKN